MVAQRVDATAVQAGDGEQRAVGQPRRRQQGADFRCDFGVAGVVDQITLAQHHAGPGQTEQMQDGQVFACLRHYAVIAGDDQQRMVDAGDTGQHIGQEFFMTGHIDKAQ